MTTLNNDWDLFLAAVARYDGEQNIDDGLNSFLREIKENDPELYQELSSLLQDFYAKEANTSSSFESNVS